MRLKSTCVFTNWNTLQKVLLKSQPIKSVNQIRPTTVANCSIVFSMYVRDVCMLTSMLAYKYFVCLKISWSVLSVKLTSALSVWVDTAQADSVDFNYFLNKCFVDVSSLTTIMLDFILKIVTLEALLGWILYIKIVTFHTLLGSVIHILKHGDIGGP